MTKKRLYSLDMMKFMAALMITNSHFQPLYEGVNTAFATFGVQGNALFFFVVGYLLMMGGHAPFSPTGCSLCFGMEHFEYRSDYCYDYVSD